MGHIHQKIMYRPDRQKRDGTFPVVMRLTHKRIVKYYPLNFDVLPKNFDEKKEKVKTSDIGYHLKNMQITKVVGRAAVAEEQFLKYGGASIEAMISILDDDRYNPECFYSFCEFLKKTKVTSRGRKLTQSTIDFYDKQIAKLKDFRDPLRLGDINVQFLNEYKEYLVKERGNNEMTYSKALEFVRRVINAAIKEDRLTKSPFRNFPISTVRGSIESLEIWEMKKLEDLYKAGTLTHGKQNVLRYFLFACYTGLRWGDIYNLRFTDIQGDEKFKWIRFTQQKTQKNNLVPLIPQAIALIPEQQFNNQKVFRVVQNQPTNNHLRAICKEMGITKRISFHSARHTCSNILMESGVPLEIRAMLIGDTERVVQQHYTDAKIGFLSKMMEMFSETIDKTP
jgi:integrase/recombinase XerC